jgi:hypothetical protein|tara:strand:- start:167 stop:652 length:486 start_codon:yes stop_codon:yes gene_type:complete
MGAGILPFTIYKGRVMFLFGRENKDKTGDNSKKGMWSDFGGSKEGKESYLDTAVREGFEESSGFFGDKEDIERLISDKCINEVEHHRYKTYVVYIPYDDKLVGNFRRNFIYVKKNNQVLYRTKGLYEKDMIKWVSYRDLKEFKHSSRVFYKGIITKLMRTM